MSNTIDLKCPSTDPTTKAVPEMYACPGCGRDVEIWTDETKGRCSSCGTVVIKDQAKLAS